MPIAYTREGDGPPLLLIHGIGLSSRAMAGISAALRERFDVIAIDLPGFGDSPPLPEPPTVPALARACRSLMREELGFGDDWYVVGNSLGGGITVDLALRGAVRGAVALSPAGFTGRGWERAYLHGAIAAVGAIAPLLRIVLPPLPPALRRAALLAFVWRGDRLAREVMLSGFEDLIRATAIHTTRRAAFPWSPAPGSASAVPLTVAWGEHDLLLITRPQSARARAKLPRATHIPIPDVGHLPGWDDPVATARLIERSLPG